MDNNIFSRLINKRWVNELGEITFDQVGNNFRCTDKEVGILFETNNKICQQVLDTNIKESIETIVNFETDTDLFLTILNSMLGQGNTSTYFYFLTFNSEDELVFLSTSAVSPKLEIKGEETIDELRTTRDVFTAL